MPVLPIQIAIAPFPTGFEGDLDDYAQQLAANMSAEVSGNFLTGQIGGTEPTQDVGPWLNNGQWWFWNPSTSQYEPQQITASASYNAFINGGMQVAQWGTNTFVQTSTSTAVTNGYVVDRWKVQIVSTAATTLGAQILINAGIIGSLTNPHCETALRLTVGTAQATQAASDAITVTQFIERSISYPLFDGVWSLSFWLRSSLTGTYCVYVRNRDNSQCFIIECVITSSNVWQLFQFPNNQAFDLSTGDWGTNPYDFAVNCGICLAAGANFQGAAGSWNAGSRLCTSNQVNFMATAANTLDMTMWKLEPGSVCSAFEMPIFPTEILRCQRYSWHSERYGSPKWLQALNARPAPSDENLIISPWTGGTFGTPTAGTMPCYIKFPVTMRTGVNVVEYAGRTPFQAGVATSVQDNTACTINGVSANPSGVSALQSTAGSFAKNGHMYSYNIYAYGDG